MTGFKGKLNIYQKDNKLTKSISYEKFFKFLIEILQYTPQNNETCYLERLCLLSWLPTINNISFSYNENKALNKFSESEGFVKVFFNTGVASITLYHTYLERPLADMMTAEKI